MMDTAPQEQPSVPQVRPALQHALDLLAAFAAPGAEENPPAPHRADVAIAPADLPAAIEALIDAQWGYLAAITGVDLGPEAGQIEVLYHLCAGADVLWLRLRLPRDDARVPTICGVIPSAGFYERELSEMLGITVVGTPDPRPLFLPEEWPQGVYPLRKDFEPGVLQGAEEINE